MSIFKSRSQKVLEAQLNLLSTLFYDIHHNMIEYLSKLNKLLSDDQFFHASGSLVTIFELCDLLTNNIKLYITQNVMEFYESDAKLSYSFEEVENKKRKSFKWLNEIRVSANVLKENISKKYDISDVYKFKGMIYESFINLQNIICDDRRFPEFANIMRSLVTEYEVNRSKSLSQKDDLMYILNNVKIHREIKKSSKNLFERGEYELAIFNALKTLENLVKKKSNIRELSGSSLMAKVFNENNPILKISEYTKTPQKSEQQGVKFLFMGSMLAIRNPLAHEDKIKINPHTALKYIIFTSLLADFLEQSVK